MPFRRSLFFSILFTLSVVSSLFAQTEPQPVLGFVSISHTFKSQILGEDRMILVHVPSDYTTKNEKYPVVYMFDAGAAQMAMMVGLLEQQSRSGQIPAMILVGITNNRRNFDLTPTADGFPGERGNGEKFMQFMEKEVIPMIEKGYQTQPFRILAGHSFGGLMVVYSLATRPDLFNGYIASSPALHWDNRLVIKQTEELFKQKREWKKTMFLAIANEPGFLSDANAFRDVVKKSNPKGFDYEFREYKDETHSSGTLLHYYAGFRKIFSGWLPPETEVFEDIQLHYNNLSKRFGFKILIPEEKFAQFGIKYAQAQQFEDAISVLKKDIESYPDSAAAHNALAIVYERNGQIRYAKDFFEKALKLAQTQGIEEIAKEARTNLERIAAKLK
jgi:uncharacterized protein